jgi:tRNA uridine 5-carboxymethylaminomethyl modification enzyme
MRLVGPDTGFDSINDGVIAESLSNILNALDETNELPKTILYSLSIENIGKMPCNPSVGGPAKGIVVREIDALGGEMGKAADATAIQFKMLNTNKGPGVQCLRVQSDKLKYAKYMLICIKLVRKI